MAVGNADPQPSPASASPAFARQIGGSPGFVNENKFCRLQIELRPKPSLTLLQNIRALLLRGVRGLLWNGPPLPPAV